MTTIILGRSSESQNESSKTKYLFIGWGNTVSIITPTSGGSVKDSAGNTFTLTTGSVLDENGSPVSGGAGTSGLTVVNGLIWAQDSTSGTWYTYSNGAFTQQSGSPPTTPTTPTPTVPTPTVPTVPTPTTPTPTHPTTPTVPTPTTPTPTHPTTPTVPTPPAPTFQDNFSALSLHLNWQAGDNWQLVAPDSTGGRGGPSWNEAGDQWWTNPYNTNTPVSGLYNLSGGVQLALLPTPSAYQAYITAQAGTAMPFVGAMLNSSQTNYQKYGYWEIIVAVPALPGFSFQADLENVQITGTWPPEIDLRISTDQTGVQTVLFAVAATAGNQDWTTTSAAGFNASLSHIYGINWQSNFITFYIDNVQVWQVATPTDGSYTTNPCFLYLLSGANYIGTGDPALASLPAYATLSSVKVWAVKPTPTPTVPTPTVPTVPTVPTPTPTVPTPTVPTVPTPTVPTPTVPTTPTPTPPTVASIQAELASVISQLQTIMAQVGTL
jgi:Glycosyl hydrolases family 16